MKHKLLLIPLTFFALVVLVLGQSGVGPNGKKLYDHRNDIIILPSGYDYTYNPAAPAITYDGGNLYFFVASTGKWSKITAATPTSTPTPSSTATATATPTP